MSDEIEEWHPVAVLVWEVSSLGRVRNPYGQILRPNSAGIYSSVALPCGGPERRQKTSYVHRLVCESFHGPRPSPQHVVRHLNNDPRDNRAENLRWGTQVENMADKKVHGTEQIGDKNANTKITEETARKVIAMYRGAVEAKTGDRARVARGTLDRISAATGVTKGNIKNIIQRKNWAHLDIAP